MDCNQIRKVAANALITCNIHSFPIDCFAILKQYFSEWCQDVRRNGMHSYDKDLYQHFYNPDYKGFVYSIRTCAFCGARVYNCLDFEAHCSGACKLPDELVRKKTHAFTPLSDDDSRILRRLENKWLYDF